MAIFGNFSEGTGWRRFECEPLNLRGGSAVPTGLLMCLLGSQVSNSQAIVCFYGALGSNPRVVQTLRAPRVQTLAFYMILGLQLVFYLRMIEPPGTKGMRRYAWMKGKSGTVLYAPNFDEQPEWT